MSVNVNPRKAILSIGLGLVVALGGTACSPHSSSGGTSTSTNKPDCDFDDLLEGDSDCNGEAGRAAEKKLSKSQKAKLKQAREKRRRGPATVNAPKSAPRANTPAAPAKTRPAVVSAPRKATKPARTVTRRR